MKNRYLLIVFALFIAACESAPSKPYLADSSGNMNNITIVMSKSQWDGVLGEFVRDELASPYEGLPLDEPRFSLRHLSPKAFSGFGRHGRNIIWFLKDTINQFQLVQNQFASPQLVAIVRGEDDEVMSEYIRENTSLLIRTFQEGERKEKIRRILKSPTKDNEFESKFFAEITYPTAYTVVKDTSNFLWIEKPIQKGTMNLIAYRLTTESFDKKTLNQVVSIRDSIGKLHIPGRLPGTFMITEKAYLPYFYKTTLDGQTAYLTKGMWEVKKDFMAGPFVNYIVEDPNNNGEWLAIEGFAFAPSVSKRDYMFELNSILSTLKFKKK